jgi:hypothetical protein
LLTWFKLDDRAEAGYSIRRKIASVANIDFNVLDFASTRRVFHRSVRAFIGGSAFGKKQTATSPKPADIYAGSRLRL